MIVTIKPVGKRTGIYFQEVSHSGDPTLRIDRKFPRDGPTRFKGSSSVTFINPRPNDYVSITCMIITNNKGIYLEDRRAGNACSAELAFA